jgi:GxxExxY protein
LLCTGHWVLGSWRVFIRRPWSCPPPSGPAFQEQREIHVFFEDEDVGLHRLDLIVGAEIIVELKAVKALEDIHYAQLKSYLKATGLRVGLLLNFNAPTLVVKRVVL